MPPPDPNSHTPLPLLEPASLLHIPIPLATSLTLSSVCRVLMSTALSTELCHKYNVHIVLIRKDNEVQVMRDTYNGHEGKVVQVYCHRWVIHIEIPARMSGVGWRNAYDDGYTSMHCCIPFFVSSVMHTTRFPRPPAWNRVTLQKTMTLWGPLLLTMAWGS
jgi:ribosomal protein L24